MIEDPKTQLLISQFEKIIQVHIRKIQHKKE